MAGVGVYNGLLDFYTSRFKIATCVRNRTTQETEYTIEAKCKDHRDIWRELLFLSQQDTGSLMTTPGQ